MRNALKLLTALLFVPALAACHKDQAQQAGDANTAAADANAVPPADVDTLPPDESSATPSNQLVNGDDSPDVNDVTNNSD